MWDTPVCPMREKFDSRIFLAAFVPQVHEEERPFVKKFDSRIPVRHDCSSNQGGEEGEC